MFASSSGNPFSPAAPVPTFQNINAETSGSCANSRLALVRFEPINKFDVSTLQSRETPAPQLFTEFDSSENSSAPATSPVTPSQPSPFGSNLNGRSNSSTTPIARMVKSALENRKLKPAELENQAWRKAAKYNAANEFTVREHIKMILENLPKVVQDYARLGRDNARLEQHNNRLVRRNRDWKQLNVEDTAKYNKLVDDYNDLSDKDTSKYNVLIGQYNKLVDQNEALEKKCEVLEKEGEKNKNQLEDLRKELLEVQTQQKKTKDELDRLQKEHKDHERQKAPADDVRLGEIGRLEKDIIQRNEQIHALQQEKDDLSRSGDKARQDAAQIPDLESRITQLQADSHIAAIERAELEQLRAEVQTKNIQLSQSKDELEKMAATSVKESAKLIEEAGLKEEQLQRLRAEIQSKDNGLSQSKGEIVAMTARSAEQSAKLAREARRKVEQRIRLRAEVQKKYIELRQSKGELRKMAAASVKESAKLAEESELRKECEALLKAFKPSALGRYRESEEEDWDVDQDDEEEALPSMEKPDDCLNSDGGRDLNLSRNFSDWSLGPSEVQMLTRKLSSCSLSSSEVQRSGTETGRTSPATSIFDLPITFAKVSSSEAQRFGTETGRTSPATSIFDLPITFAKDDEVKDPKDDAGSSTKSDEENNEDDDGDSHAWISDESDAEGDDESDGEDGDREDNVKDQPLTMGGYTVERPTAIEAEDAEGSDAEDEEKSDSWDDESDADEDVDEKPLTLGGYPMEMPT